MTASPHKKPGMSNTRSILLTILLISVVGALGYWWYTKLEWTEEEIDQGYSTEALQNDFLAAELFLRKHGIPATTVKNLSLLDKHRWRNIELGRDDTIVLINANKTLDEERYDNLYEWVENGGTLITSTQNPFIGTHTSEEDLLLSDFGITPAEPDQAEDEKDFFDSFSDDSDDDQNPGDDKELDDEKSADNASADSKKDQQETAKDNTLDEKNQASQNHDLKNQDQKNQDQKKQESNDKKDKKSKNKKEPEKPENYYRCNISGPTTDINFADEEKPLQFDFSRNAPFTYHYNPDAEENADESALDKDGIDEETDENNSDENSSDENISEEITPDDNADENDTGSAIDSESDIDDSDEDSEASSVSEEKHLLFFEIGDGSITITSDNYIWSNRRVDCHDHAYALWSLVNPNGRVWFLVNQDAPSLAAIIWEHAKYAVLAGLLALALWLWSSGTRFGPVFSVPQQGRRSLAEHIYASAMLLWRKQEHPQLLTLLRAEIQERLVQQMLSPENVQQQIEFLHSLTGLTQADIQQALFTNNLTHPQDFTRAIAHLQLIRKYL